jgi:hypothetical protein
VHDTVTTLFNISLSSGQFPDSFKHAIVIPLLKKHNMNKTELKNYRPVSNLPFLSKLLERIVQNQLQSHLNVHGLMPSTQSAYRAYHSTETALLKICNDILLAADEGDVKALCMLDLTAAFDTVDHDVLLSKLQQMFGISGMVLTWLKSYLMNRTYRVIYAGRLSGRIVIICSVPQGSVLGPLLFILYVADVSDLVARHNMNCHSFADDTELYRCSKPDLAAAVASEISGCMSELSEWMSSHRLKLNQDKTEFMWFGTLNQLAKLREDMPQLTLGNCVIPVSDEARSLGVILDSDLAMKRHVQTVSRGSFFQLRQLRNIRHSVDPSTAATLVHAFVTSRLDYCNSLLAGAHRVVTDVLQNVQNAAARLLTGHGRRQHGLQQVLRDRLHWLPIVDRINYKLCLLVYKALHGLAPDYLSVLCIPVASDQYRTRLRSAHHGDLIVPRVRLTRYGQRAFAYAAPCAWNSLPVHLKDHSLTLDIFKRRLKHHFLTKL